MYTSTEPTITRRVFIVGCPRSGTTLLQGMLAAHPGIHSFPETHFFSMAYPRNRLKRLVTWPALNVQGVLERLLAEIGRQDLQSAAKISPFTRRYAQKFIAILDQLTLEAGKQIWVEKTPRHLHFIEAIRSQVPGANFIHIVRNGVDVVASLFAATQENPRAWAKGRVRGFSGFSIDECIARWNHDVQISARYRMAPDHHVVRYEKLIAAPDATLRALAAFLGVNYTPKMQAAEQAFTQIVTGAEPWKAGNAAAVQQPASKFERVFSAAEQEYICAQLLKIDF